MLLYGNNRLYGRSGGDKNGEERAPADLRPLWRHIAFTWDRPASQVHLYVDGREYRANGDKDNLHLTPPYGHSAYSRLLPFQSFVIGTAGSRLAQGTMDNFALYTKPLNAATIRGLAAAFKPVGVSLDRHYALSGRNIATSAKLSNLSDDAVAVSWSLTDPDGKCVESSHDPLRIAARETVPLPFTIASAKKGCYRLHAQVRQGRRVQILGDGSEKSYEGTAGAG
jgi:hypothetical protein